uniref:Aminotransferase-like protein n=1 Tax=Oryza sativa subsp. japonica TaxID=39947 RepID=Q10KH5_ORYSJ|nr:hypothetical protein LOC_Os03g26690 [Oryza sativa Japonica Group]
MSTSTGPSAAPSTSPSAAPPAEYAEHLSNLVAVPSLSHDHQYFLGPIGNLDPTEFIIVETNRIPFRLANPNISHWKNTFKSWPSLEKSWPVWYKRVSASMQAHWDEIGIGQALSLTIANSAKDEPLIAAATYFWSNTLNAFLFNQGPMTPTLLDIIMITGLDVTSSANSMSLNTKNTFDFKTKSIGGWSGYIAAYMGKRPVTSREHVAFLLMWLEKFLFCGSSSGPTTNWQFLAEALETKRQFPLGKILLGYLYQMLNNASAKIAVGSVVGAGGPWWLLQSWLNLVAMKAVNQPSVTEAEFPRLEPITDEDGEERTHRRLSCIDFDLQLEDQINWHALEPKGKIFWTCTGVKQISQASCFYINNIPRPQLGSIENIELARFRSKAFDRWWGEWKLHLFHQSASMYMIDLFLEAIPQTTESSPPCKSKSGEDIDYAPGLVPNGGGPSPPVIGYHAPKTSSLLQGQLREPADASKKRKTKASTVDPSALAPKKRAKKKKSKPTDDLPALDPSIEQALDEEEIEEDVDQAAAELSNPEKTPSASPKQTPPTPAAPAHFSRKKKTTVKKKSAAIQSKPAPPPETSNRTPSAAGSHNVEEEEQPAAPAIPVLADLFSFDIKDYLDETEEDTTSKALASLSDDVKRTLEDISHRLEESSLDTLVVDYGSIRARLHKIQALIPNELANALTPAVYLEQHQFKLEKAKQRLADHRERKDIEATIQLSEGPIKSNIDRLEARKIELIAQLEECNAELALEQKKLADLPKAIEEQKSQLKSAIRNVVDMTKSLKVIPGTDAQDVQALEEVEQIRQRAISAIQRYLSQ